MLRDRSDFSAGLFFHSIEPYNVMLVYTMMSHALLVVSVFSIALKVHTPRFGIGALRCPWWGFDVSVMQDQLSIAFAFELTISLLFRKLK